MHQLQFKCELQTDLVLISNAATEGFHRSLDYIPGAKFLGIVANHAYPEDGYEGDLQLLELLHSNKVQFGDAYPLIKGVRALPTPLNWMKPKGTNPDKIYQYHNLSLDDRMDYNAVGIQLEKMGVSYIHPQSKALLKIEQNFSIKSAYDRTLRRSAEEQMYGYFALERGTTWCFNVWMEDQTHEAIIIAALAGEKGGSKRQRIGRSKSAEYGVVEIAEATFEDFAETNDEASTILLYAASNWCFYDQGKSTAQVQWKHLFGEEDFKEDQNNYIDWQKSTLRTRAYRTWNYKRKNRDADRIIIEKGSVLALQLSETYRRQLHALSTGKGIGAHRNEGMGAVLLNPSFLSTAKTFDFPESIELERRKTYIRTNAHQQAQEDRLIAALTRRKEAASAELQIAATIQNLLNDPNFNQKFKGITSSQWGLIRKRAKIAGNAAALNKMLFDEKTGLLKTGQTQSMWKEKDRANELKKILFEKYPKFESTQLAEKLAQELHIKTQKQTA